MDGRRANSLGTLAQLASVDLDIPNNELPHHRSVNWLARRRSSINFRSGATERGDSVCICGARSSSATAPSVGTVALTKESARKRLRGSSRNKSEAWPRRIV